MSFHEVLEELLNIDYGFVTRYIVSRIKEVVDSAGVNNVVVGLSGGLDSSVTTRLLAEALGSNRVLAFIMPYSKATSEEDVEHALELAKSLNIEYRVLRIDSIVDEFIRIIGVEAPEPVPLGNLMSRVRMAILYYYSNSARALVAGTSDKSEILIGYFTKYGDGAADFYPIACLYKTQVRRLAEYLGLPTYIVRKPSSPGFWKGHLAENEIGLKYEVIDVVLYLLFDKKLDADSIVAQYGLDRDVVRRVIEMYRRSVHKRKLIDERDLLLPL